ncbi:uracil-DNA glycosylase [Hydrogenimonas thermophila]|uniref:uracil-DNA glycosylase n=1 Tax=Hydrogenimonas thermophila TaxID=223786 RepID=UPI002936F7D2|nr:uracil-DNA glycosylase [Hydrogenimonas thermophila]WOE68996.1 uracil-DNA glycosylase [Hydrogenimonas thermophila]WOE71504.1 uracil-DNA glycosylase [Hydrogenimonas thermophila]WOE71507.1 uracil-DNA glycosylase [Hydrogenimonas thermophila]
MNRLYNALQLKRLYQLKNLGMKYVPLVEKRVATGTSLPNSFQTLEQLVLQCHLCPLSKTRTKTVFGEGDTNAALMFVGEGPGAQEDITGRPFVGRAGELLTKMIENAIEIPRSKTYIANIVKCRPPNNRVPTPDEAYTCIPYLQKQIELVSPSIIVALGSTAYHYLTGDKSGISKVRGETIDMGNYILIPTYHPSYLLRNPSAKKEVYQDLLKIKRLLCENC